MRSLEIPFWIIAERKHILDPPAHIPCAEPDAAHAFTTAEKLAAFMSARGGARWDINQVATREGVIVAIAELHAQGIGTICIDAEPDGSGGVLVSISDVLQAYPGN